MKKIKKLISKVVRYTLILIAVTFVGWTGYATYVVYSDDATTYVRSAASTTTKFVEKPDPIAEARARVEKEKAEYEEALAEAQKLIEDLASSTSGHQMWLERETVGFTNAQ